jgi:hypothetical protein
MDRRVGNNHDEPCTSAEILKNPPFVGFLDVYSLGAIRDVEREELRWREIR